MKLKEMMTTMQKTLLIKHEEQKRKMDVFKRDMALLKRKVGA